MGLRGLLIVIAAVLLAIGTEHAAAQPCNTGYTFTASPPPVGGEYQSGQTVTFCYTVTNWNIVNVNWFHGISIAPGPGWDMSTLTPGPPPPTCGASGGTWGWYDICDGTSGTAVPPVGPGFFFDLDNDGDPGNNFGDLCSGAVDWQFCWTITTNSGAACIDGVNAGMTVNSYGDSETGSWGSAGCGGDPIGTLPAVMNCCSANAGTNGAVTLCANGAVVNLATYLGGTPDPGGTWSAPGGGSTGPTLDPTVAVSGNYTYTVTSGSCSSSAIVAVTINPPPDAGADGFLAICSNNAPTNLGTIITGEQPGGVWTDPANAPFSGWYDPAINASGVYTYTLTGTAPCASDQSTVVVNETSPPSAGTDGATSVCADGAAIDLFGLLGGAPQAGGNWSAPGGAGTTSTFTPGTSTPGPYIYTVLGTAPCGSDQAIVTVTQINPVNAGADGAITVCADGAPIDLFASLAGAGAGGTWTAPGGSGSTNTYTPGISAPGVYTYTLSATAPCVDDQATVTVAQNAPVNAGTDGSTTVCADGPVLDLYTLLGNSPDAGGTWAAPGGGPSLNTFTPGSSAPGAYTYTVSALAPCPDDQSTVTITQNTPVDAGIDGAITLCTDGAPVDLFASLSGAGAGGTWTGPGGGAVTSTYTPGTSAPGVYTYTLTAIAPCSNDQSTVTVTQNNPVDAGVDGATTVCSDAEAIDLFSLLAGSPDAGGAWTAPGGGGSSNIYTPGTSLPGVYTYELAAIAPCANDQSTVTVAQNDPVHAGSDGAVTVCDVDGIVDLFALLGAADPGGTWTGPGGGANGGNFVPGTSAPGVYQYTVTALAPCANDQSAVTVVQNSAVDAGTDGLITVCSDGSPVDLQSLLGGAPDAGGTWSDPGGGSVASTYVPGNSTPGNYTYTVTGIAPCPIDQATVTVVQNDPVDAGSDGALTVCADGAPLDLFGLLGGGPDGGGAWSGPGGTANDGTFTPGTSTAGTYTYTVIAMAPCPNDQADVIITVNDPVDAGSDAALTVCSDGPAVDLFGLLGGGPDGGGTWTGPGGGSSTGTYIPGSAPAGAYTYTVAALAPCADDGSVVTITENDPLDAGSDGAITVCATDAVVDLSTLLGGTPAPGGSWTGPGGGSTTNSYTPGTSTPGTYTYTVTPLAPCVAEQATITVTQDQPVDAGTDGAVTLCISSPVTDLFASLGGSPDAGGTWTAPGGGMFDGSFTPGTDQPGVYTYSVTAPGPCPSASATVTVAVVSLPDPGTSGAITLCTSGPTQDLFAVLGGTPDAGGSWTGPGGGAHTGALDPASDAPGVYTYTINVPPPCASVSSTVTITLQAPPDPGLPGSVLLCVTSPAIDLFGSLSGSPDGGGTWGTPGGGAFSGTFTPGMSVPGQYTYTVAGISPCPDLSTTVDVAVTSIPDAGTDGNITLCTSGAAQDLFTLLGGTPDVGGTWSAPGGGTHPGTVDPSNDPAGVYTYTITAPAPCPSVSSAVVVTLQAPPDPGSDGALLLCATSPSVDLFSALVGSPDAGGSWTGPGGAAFSGPFVPGSDPPGVYTYTVTGVAPCPNASASVTVAVTEIPDAGSDGSATLCTTGAQLDLFGVLGGTPDGGGVWTGPGGTANTGVVDPASDPAGGYTYTITAPAPCPSVSSEVSIVLQTPPDPGSDGSALLCVTSPAADLFGSLQGTPAAGGSWSAPGGSAFTGTFVPGSDVPGLYTYTVPGIAPCPAAWAVVDVTVMDIPDPGTAGSTTLCTSGSVVDLFTLLGGAPDAGGTWAAPGGVGHTGTLDPAVDPAGTYTYTIAVPPPCASVSSTVTITLQLPPEPGEDGTAVLCVSSPPTDLFLSLSGTPDPGGSWTSPGGGTFNGTFLPGTSTPGTYTYTAQGTAPCPNAAAVVDVQVISYPDPGINGLLDLCATDAAVPLFASLGGTPDPGGTWTSPDGTTHADTFDPAVDPAGGYTYTIAVPAPCSSVSATVTVSVQTPPDPGASGALSLCISGSGTSLFGALGGTPDSGGGWSDPLGDATDATFIPGTDLAGTYTYTLTGLAPCPSASAQVIVSVNEEPDAGVNGAVVLCTGGAPVDLFGSLGGSPDPGGSWSGPGGGPNSGLFDPATDAAGVYMYTITVPPPCSNASSTVTVVVQPGPDPGTDGTATLCATDGPLLLFPLLGGTPDANGTWTSPLGNPSDGTFDPATDEAGSYTYTLVANAPCAAAMSQVSISVSQVPDAGGNGAITLCASDADQSLFSLLNGTPDGTGHWTTPGGTAHSGIFETGNDAPGMYTYTVDGAAPCPSDDAVVVVTVETPPDAGSDGTLSLCSSGGSEDLFAALNGTPEQGGTWSAPGGDPSDGSLDPSAAAGGSYIYTVIGTSPCPAASAQVSVTITEAADAGANGAILLCSASSPIDLFDHLNGTPGTNGTWTAPGGSASTGDFDPGTGAPGIYTYTVLGTAPCPDASATVLVTVTSNPDAGLPGETTLCMSDGAMPLLEVLSGTPDDGGSWTAPDGAPHTGLFDPGADAEGTYTYLIDVPPPCVSASSSVTIALVAPADPGPGGELTICTSSPVTDLFVQLAGTPPNDGTWSLNGVPHDGMLDPAIDPSGSYVYTLISDAPCPAMSAAVEVTVNSPADPGTSGTALLCASGDAVLLSGFLGGTPEPGGQWSLNGVPHLDLIDPATDAGGVYTYTVASLVPCAATSSDVTVTISAEPDAGSDGLATICLSDAPIDLFGELGGTPDTVGSWSGPSVVVNGMFDPAVMVAGEYTYLIEVPAPCTNASSVVTVFTVTPPDAGTDGEALLCISSPATDLYTLLEGMPDGGGTWTDPEGVAHGVLFNPASDAAGDYTYTVNGSTPCPSAQAVVTMAVVSEPDPGGNGALLLCQTDPAEDLFERLEGSPDAGGVWSGPSASPDGLFDPATMAPGEYTYTLDAPEPCSDASSTVLVSVSTPPDAGADGNGSLCTTSDAIDLYSLLTGTPATGGTWTAPGGSGHTSLFNPAQDIEGLYTYTVPGDVPCAAATATVLIVLSEPPEAGMDGSVTLCPEAEPVDLFELLGGSPDTGGVWTGPGGTEHGAILDPSVDEEGTYSYALIGIPPCGHDVSLVVVDVSAPVLATATGADAICHDACDGTATVNIQSGTPGYTMQWSGNVAGSDAMEASGLCAGNYTITITDANGCTGIANCTIGEPPPLMIDAIGVGDENCIGSCDGYLNIVDGAGVLFSINGGDTWVAGNVITDLCAGGYLVMMQDANGCLASSSAYIASPPPVTAGFYGAPDTMSVTNTTVEFTNQSGYATTFLWDFGGLATSTEGNPSFTFPDVLGGTYSVCLTAMDENGCADSICQPIVVLDELFVTVPNAFSPNGDDINDLFVPVFNIAANAEEYSFMIFDRWGLRIFTSETVGETWDGSLNGETVQQDVYIWKMHCKDRITREEYDLVGHVTVVK